MTYLIKNKTRALSEAIYKDGKYVTVAIPLGVSEQEDWVVDSPQIKKLIQKGFITIKAKKRNTDHNPKKHKPVKK